MLMHDAEFNELTEQLVRALLPRIPDDYRPSFEYMIKGGEFVMALNDIVFLLVEEKVPVQPSELEVLQTLVDE
jgi:hypothetical protein